MLMLQERKVITGFLVLFCLVVIAGCTAQTPVETQENTPIEEEEGDKITLASGEWAPYVSEELKHEGIVSRVVRESFELRGIDVEFVYLPWKRSIEEAKSGKWDGTLPWLKNEEREADFWFSDPIAHENVVFFHKNDIDFEWETVDDVKGYTIGGTVGYYYGEEFDSAEKNGTLIIDRAVEDKMNFQKLDAGRVDIVICEIDVGYEIIDKLFSAEKEKEFIHHPTPISSNSLFLLLSKNITENAGLIESFNMGLRRLTESGKVEQYWNESRRGIYAIKEES